jgi:type IV pilus assembly protein PilN
MTQETRNSYLDSNITRLNNKLKIVSEFNQQIRQINSKIELVKQVDEKRDDMVALLQQLSKVTPTGVNFSSLIIDNNKVDFNGSAASPLYVADFLQNLRDAGKIFSQPMLKSNTTTDGNSYNFVISAELESNLSAETLP